jgi:hypothetical protein
MLNIFTDLLDGSTAVMAWSPRELIIAINIDCIVLVIHFEVKLKTYFDRVIVRASTKISFDWIDSCS